jgi:nucleoside-diphosphate-sugar epimerase
VHRDKSDVNKISVRTKQKINFVNLGDPTSIEECFSENEIESIIHTATNYGRNGESQDLVKEANLSLPIRILELAIENKVPHFLNIHLSTKETIFIRICPITQKQKENSPQFLCRVQIKFK